MCELEFPTCIKIKKKKKSRENFSSCPRIPTSKYLNTPQFQFPPLERREKERDGRGKGERLRESGGGKGSIKRPISSLSHFNCWIWRSEDRNPNPIISSLCTFDCTSVLFFLFLSAPNLSCFVRFCFEPRTAKKCELEISQPVMACISDLTFKFSG